MAISPEKHQRTRQLFLWMMACVFLFAFASLYCQIPGLYGPSGLTPVDVTSEPSKEGWLQRWLSFPSLVGFSRDVGLSPHHMMELCCVMGVLLAALMMIFHAMRCSLMFLLLWLLYLSVYKVGKVFMWFQWDSLLLEAGLLAVFAAPFNLVFWKKPTPQAHDGIPLWLLRWLLFRLMFASGVVKLTSQCPTWWGLTALDYHYESQCIPSPLAWYAHQLPHWFQRLSVVATYFIESVTPILFFMPVRSLRLVGFWLQVFLQVLIILTGNYNFFNLLTIVLCIPLLDDACLMWDSGRAPPPLSSTIFNKIFGSFGNTILSLLRGMAFFTVIGYMLATTVYYFGISVDLQRWIIVSDATFTSDDLNVMLTIVVPILALVGFVSLAIEIVNAVFQALLTPGLLQRCSSLIHAGVFALIGTAFFSVSLVPYSMLEGSFYHSLPSPVLSLHSTLNKYSITNAYGLFRRMTGVGGRPELIVEGTNDLQSGPWQEYDFLYKPGNLFGMPPYIAPHQPRLDWQMWFAALGGYESNPWLVHLVYKLLSGQKEVLQLLAPPPFKTPPRYIRVIRYNYHFTAYNKDKSFFNQTKAWWHRDTQKDYLFPLALDSPGLLEYLSKQNYLTQRKDMELTPVAMTLQWLREVCDHLSPPVLIWSLFSCSLVPTIFMST